MTSAAMQARVKKLEDERSSLATAVDACIREMSRRDEENNIIHKQILDDLAKLREECEERDKALAGRVDALVERIARHSQSKRAA